MEKENFHENLTALHERFGKETVFINLSHAAKYCGIDTRTLLADRTFPRKKMGRYYKVALISFARWLS